MLSTKMKKNKNKRKETKIKENTGNLETSKGKNI